jgi:hypothetical protein
VVESSTYQIEVSLPEWEMSDEEQQRQHELNVESMRRFLNRLEASLRAPGPAVRVPEDREMDEYEWERFLKESDARTERYGELLDKFQKEPDGERIIAHHMGWRQLEEALGELQAGADDTDDAESEEWNAPDLDDWEEPEPDPAQEGIDWIRTERGRIEHPVQHRCHELGMRMFFDAKERGLHPVESGDPAPDVSLMVFQVQRVSVKMAGALAGLARGGHSPAGFIVASLKRALGFLHEALNTMEKVESDGKMADTLPGYRREALEIRGEIIDLMNRFRNGI